MDADGHYHFNGIFRNGEELESALNKFKTGPYSQLIDLEKGRILEIYETLFDHQSFTGRSGTFYGYEGLGSIYWHMVSKLLLATQECYFNALEKDADSSLAGKLKEHYYEIKAGIGLYKSPEIYGAFPMDPYSHSPGNTGVRQPGLTGQVKEDVISRFGELGLRIRDGEILIDTALINPEEILKGKAEFEYYTLEGKWQKIQLKQNQFAFTFWQVPFVFTKSSVNNTIIKYIKGDRTEIHGHILNRELSSHLFARSGIIEQIEVAFQSGRTNL